MAIPQAVEPFYRQLGVDRPVPLYRGPITATHGQQVTSARAVIRADLRAGFDVSATYFTPVDLGSPGDPFRFHRLPDISLDAHPRAVPRPTTIPRLRPPTAAHSEHKRRAGNLIWHSDGQVSRVVAHIVNFPDAPTGRPVRYPDGSGADRIYAVAGDWAVTIDAHADGRRLTDQLTEGGGFLLTHVVAVEREDGRSFDFAESSHVLEALTMFLWFVAGRRVTPILPVGFATDGTPVAADWGERAVDRWRPAVSWIDPVHGGADVEHLLPLWLACWEDPHWREVLTLTAHYYVSANHPNPVQAAIALAQIPLELLCWTVAFPLRYWPDEDAYRTDTAAARLRKLLARLGIATAIPPHLTRLADLANRDGRGWDGPAAFTGTRNQIIHPTRPSSKRVDFQTDIEAWRLGVMYVELAVLSMLGYAGRYLARTGEQQAGAGVQVPWPASQGRRWT